MNFHIERLKMQMQLDRRRRWLRRLLWDFWDDHSGDVAVLMWSVVALLIGYGIWVVCH